MPEDIITKARQAALKQQQVSDAQLKGRSYIADGQAQRLQDERKAEQHKKNPYGDPYWMTQIELDLAGKINLNNIGSILDTEYSDLPSDKRAILERHLKSELTAARNNRIKEERRLEAERIEKQRQEIQKYAPKDDSSPVNNKIFEENFNPETGEISPEFKAYKSKEDEFNALKAKTKAEIYKKTSNDIYNSLKVDPEQYSVYNPLRYIAHATNAVKGLEGMIGGVAVATFTGGLGIYSKDSKRYNQLEKELNTVVIPKAKEQFTDVIHKQFFEDYNLVDPTEGATLEVGTAYKNLFLNQGDNKSKTPEELRKDRESSMESAKTPEGMIKYITSELDKELKLRKVYTGDKSGDIQIPAMPFPSEEARDKAMSENKNRISLLKSYLSVADNYKKYIEGGVGGTAWGNTGGAFWESAKASTVDFIENVDISGIMSRAVSDPESLTDTEVAILRAGALSESSSNLVSSATKDIFNSVGMSTAFMAEMFVTGTILKGAGKGLSKVPAIAEAYTALKTSKKASEAYKFLSSTGKIGRNALTGILTPTAANIGFDKYYGQVQVVKNAEGKDEILGTEAQKDAYVVQTLSDIKGINEKRNAIKTIDQEINELRKSLEEPGNSGMSEEEIENYKNFRSAEISKEIEDLNSRRDLLLEQLSLVIDEDGKLINEDVSIGSAIFSGASQGGVMSLVERYGGAWIDSKVTVPTYSQVVNKAMKKNNWLGRRASALDRTTLAWGNTIDNLLSNNKIGKVGKSIYTHAAPRGMLNSVTGEIGEEIIETLVPAFGEDYYEQTSQLFTPDFWINTALSTAIQNTGMTLLGGALHGVKYGTSKKYKAATDKSNNDYKAATRLYSILDNSTDSDALADVIAMSNPNTIFEESEYKGMVADLRNDSKPFEGLSMDQRNYLADDIERKAFADFAYHAVATGTETQANTSLQRIISNPKSSKETVESAKEALAKLRRYKAITIRNKGKVNAGILNHLEVASDMMQEGIDKAKDISQKAELTLSQQMNTYNSENGIDGLKFNTDYVMDNMYPKDPKNPTEAELEVMQYIGGLSKRFGEDFENQASIAATIRVAEKTRQAYEDKINYQNDPENRKAIEDKIKEDQKAELKKVLAAEGATLTDAQAKALLKNVDEAGIGSPDVIAAINAAKISPVGNTTSVEPANTPSATSSKEAIDKAFNIAPDSSDSLDSIFGEFKSTDTSVPADNNTLTPPNPSEAVAEPIGETTDNTVRELSPQELEDLNEISDGNFAPVTRKSGDADQNKFISSLTSGFKQVLKDQPDFSFDSLILGLRSSQNQRKVEQGMNLIREAWDNATGKTMSDSEFNSVYKDNFGNLDKIAAINEAFGGTEITGNTNVDVTNTPIEKTTKETPEGAQKVFDPITETTVEPSYRAHTSRLYAGTGLKLGGVLGIEFTYTPDGKVDNTNKVGENAKPFMDFRNFTPGSTVDLVFDFNYLLGNNKLSIWENLDAQNLNDQDSKPTKRVITVRERLMGSPEKGITGVLEGIPGLETWPAVAAEIKILADISDKIADGIATALDIATLQNSPLFKSPEFLEMVPVGTINNGLAPTTKEDGTPNKILFGGLNETQWFNNANVALQVSKATDAPMVEERALRIEKNKKANIQARKAILQSGKFSAKVLSNSDAKINIRILKTPEEKKDGHTKEFYSVFSQFQNSLEDFYNNATIGVFDSSMNIISGKTNSEEVIATINGVQINSSNVTNYDKLVKNAKKKGFGAGRTLLIVKSGVDKKGKPLFTAHDVINNHGDKQLEFRKSKEKIEGIISGLVINPSDTAAGITKKKQLQAAFKKTFGYEVNAITKFMLLDLFPKPLSKFPGLRQDYAKKAQHSSTIKMIPNVSNFESAQDFIDALIVGGDGLAIDKRQMLLSNLHTNVVFTPITNNGEIVFTSGSQPTMMFEAPADIKSTKSENSEINKVLDNLNKSKQVIQKFKDEAETVEEKELLDKDLKNIESQISSLEDMKKTSDNIDNESNVEETDTTPKEEDREFDSRDLDAAVEELFSRILVGIDLKSSVNVIDLLLGASEEIQKLINELKNSGKTREATFLELNRGTILGNNGYDGSLREILDLTFDVDSSEVDINEFGYNIKEVGQASYEIDVTKSLGLKTRIMLSGIPDPKSEKHFAGFSRNLPPSTVSKALQQVLSQLNNNSPKELIETLRAKAQENSKEFGFYDTVADRLEAALDSTPEIVNEVLYSLYQPLVNMKFAMITHGESGMMTIKSFDANVRNPQFTKRNMWSEQIKNNGLLDLYEGNLYRVNETKYKETSDLYKEVLQQYEGKDITKVDRRALTTLLNNLGISLSSTSLDSMYSQTSQSGSKLESLLLGGTKSAIPLVMANIDIVRSGISEYSMSPVSIPGRDVFSLNPLRHNVSILNDIIKIDNANEFSALESLYTSGKTIQPTQQFNNITSSIRDIKESITDYMEALKDDTIPDDEKMSGLLKDLASSPITSNSMLLGMLKRNPSEALKTLEAQLISLESIKEQNTPSRDDAGITQTAEKDQLISLSTFFTSSEGVYSDEDFEIETGIKLRKGTVPTMTLSDSSQLPLIQTVLLSIKEGDVDSKNSTIGESLLKILRDQLVFPDLLRKADFFVKMKGESSNIEGYDAGAQWITGIPSLNVIPVTIKAESKIKEDDAEDTIEEDTQDTDNEDEVGDRVRSLKLAFEEMLMSEKFQSSLVDDSGEYKSNVDELIKEATENFISEHSTEIDKEISAHIKSEVDALISEDGTTGKLVDYDLTDNLDIKLSDGKGDRSYFMGKSARLVAYDYVINTTLQLKEFQTIFGGDIALYFKDSMNNGIKNGLPTITASDIMEHMYSDSISMTTYNTIVGKVDVVDLSEDKKRELIENFPNLKFSDEFLDLKDPNTGASVDAEQAYQVLLPISRYKVNKMFMDVQNNLSKRMKGQISPGNRLADVKNQKPYVQLMLSDVSRMSNTIESLMETAYKGKLDTKRPRSSKTIRQELAELKTLSDIYSRTSEQNKRYKKLMDMMESKFPKVAPFLKAASTDAQEYVTANEALLQLKSQGRMPFEMFDNVTKKLKRQSEDLDRGTEILEENLLTKEELKYFTGQPSKPLHAGVNYQNVNKSGHNVGRFVYVKSSSFPLIPQLTRMFPKLDAVRKNIERIERIEGTTVRVSYQSANKVGAVKSSLSIEDLYKDPSELNMDKIRSSSLLLDRKHFSIQKDLPVHDSSKQHRSSRATQFEKMILGDGISQITDPVFPSGAFDSTLLSDLNIKSGDNNMISGKDLASIYKELYKREQKLLSDKLFNQLGIDAYSDIQEGKPKVMENIARIINKKLSNKQDKDAIKLIYVAVVNGKIEYLSKAEVVARGVEPESAIFKFPLFMTPNSRKFESVFNSVVGNNNIKLDVPGFHSPIASQEGFDYKGFSDDVYEEASKRGLILSPSFNPKEGLKSSRIENGVLKPAQVLAPNKYQIFNTTTGKYEMVNLKDYLYPDSNILDESRIPEEIRSMFSFRVPTSSHQSGMLIEIVGFLPEEMGDLMIVPSDSTVQIGEDFDIDTRYVYQYNLLKTEDGTIKKMDYGDIGRITNADFSELKDEFENSKTELWNQFFEERPTVTQVDVLNSNNFTVDIKNPYLKHNKDNIFEIVLLEQELQRLRRGEALSINTEESLTDDAASMETQLEERIAELEFTLIPENIVRTEENNLREEYRNLKKAIREAYIFDKSSLATNAKRLDDAYRQKANEKKVIENQVVALHKAVYSSPSAEVQNLITKVLSTDMAEDSAAMIDTKRKGKQDHFSIYSAALQNEVMNRGSSGKIGIGVHSNAVTMNSILQQLSDPIQFFNSTTLEDGTVQTSPYNIQLGEFVFDGVLGKVKIGDKRITEFLMESQNSATDNQKLEIMGRRNENSNTISVFSLLQMSGIESVELNGKDVSYASLYISQPSIIAYSNRVDELQAISNTGDTGRADKQAAKEVLDSYRNRVPRDKWKVNDMGKTLVGILSESALKEAGALANSQNLYSEITPDSDANTGDPLLQYYVLSNFMKLKGLASELGKLQKFVNIESDGLGLSYFDILAKKDFIKDINSLSLLPASQVGLNSADFTKSLTSNMFGDTSSVKLDEDYIEIEPGNLYIKPNTHYAHKIFNSISLGYNLWNSLFPYDSNIMTSQLDSIAEAFGVDLSSKEGLKLKYAVMSGMKDYSYTNSKTLFGDNVDAFQKELFFDNHAESKESLGSYLLKLKKDKKYSYIFDNILFKGLQPILGDKEYPTIIKFNGGGMSKLDNSRMNRDLERLSNSDVQLPPKMNGDAVTEASLIKDLAIYAMLADQGNGAIGFRNMIPVSVFEKFGIDKLLRNRNNLKSVMSSLSYKGAISTATAYLGSEMDQFGVIKNATDKSEGSLVNFAAQLNGFLKRETGMDNSFIINENNDLSFVYFNGDSVNNTPFVKQYVQHNPGKVDNPLSTVEVNSTFESILVENRIYTNDFDNGSITGFSTSSTRAPYITINTSTGIQLFEKHDSMDTKDTTDADITYSHYKRIPVLGTFGFNEYQSGKNIVHSKIGRNNFKQGRDASQVFSTNEVKPYNAKEILNSLTNDVNNPHYHLIAALRAAMPELENLNVEVVPSLEGDAKFISGENKILVNQELISKATNKEIQDKLAEEIVHAVTTNLFSKYITITGFTKEGKLAYTENEGVEIPSEMKTIISVYNKALSHYAKKHGTKELFSNMVSFKKAIKTGENNSVTISSGVQEDAYRTQDIHEFMAGLFIKDSDFSKEMSKTEYLSSGKSIIGKFVESFVKLIHKILPNAKKNSMSVTAANALFKLLSDKSRPSQANTNTPPVNTPKGSMTDKMNTVKDLADSVRGEVKITDTDTDNKVGEQLSMYFEGMTDNSKIDNTVEINGNKINPKEDLDSPCNGGASV